VEIMSEFNIDNFLDETTCKYPEWLNLNNSLEMIYYNEISNQTQQITLLIEQNKDSKLTPSMIKITASSLAAVANQKNRSSFTEKRYSNLYAHMKKENTRLALLWKAKVDSLKKSSSKETKLTLKDKVALLEDEVQQLKLTADRQFIGEIIEARRKFRFTDFKRTIDDKDKRIEELEIQNAELQLKLRDMLRPIK
jgi:hypothetical protein